MSAEGTGTYSGAGPGAASGADPALVEGPQVRAIPSPHKITIYFPPYPPEVEAAARSRSAPAGDLPPGAGATEPTGDDSGVAPAVDDSRLGGEDHGSSDIPGVDLSDADGGPGSDLDPSASVAGLRIVPEGPFLGIPVPLATQPSQWPHSAKRLSLVVDEPPVAMAASLHQTSLAGTDGVFEEWDGMAAVSVLGHGLQAIGSYTSVGATDGCTSLFVFADVGFPLGGPPAFFVEGLAGGLGYNRRLQVPSDPTDVLRFPFIRAIEQAPMSLSDEMSQLGSIVPARSGSYWLAAGAKFTSFDLLHTVGLAYAVLDRIPTVGVLGVSSLQFPPGTEPVADVKLAVNFSYSTGTGALSARGQLTDSSWLISPNCQLTGGFAFVIWSPEHNFVFTIGGYSPAFTVPAGFPSVHGARFAWAASSSVSVKGEAYFALLSSAVMFGGALETTYTTRAIRMWFATWLDVLATWGPFSYSLPVGVSVGAAIRLPTTFSTLSLTVQTGAAVLLAGPPLHGNVSIKLDVASLTVSFGPAPPEPAFLPYTTVPGTDVSFESRYLSVTSDPGNGKLVPATLGVLSGVSPGTCMTPASTGTATAPDGSSPENALPVLPCFALRTESKLPITKFRLAGDPIDIIGELPVGEPPVGEPPVGEPPVGGPLVAGAQSTIDLVPCGTNLQDVTVTHDLGTAGPGKDTVLGALLESCTVTSRVTGFSTAVYQNAAQSAVPADMSTSSFLAPGGLDVSFNSVLSGGPVAVAFSSVDSGASPGAIPAPALADAGGAATASTPATDGAAPTDIAASAEEPQAQPPPEKKTSATVVNLRNRVVSPQPTGAPGQALAVPAVGAVVHDLGGNGAPAPANVTGPARVTCLSADGHVLADHPALSGALGPFPAGTRHLVAMPANSQADARQCARASGWRGASRLLLVAPATALCPGGALLVPGPVGKNTPCLATARSLMSGRDGCQVLLPASVGVVAVFLELRPGRQWPADGMGDLAVGISRAGPVATWPARTPAGQVVMMGVPGLAGSGNSASTLARAGVAGAPVPLRVSLKSTEDWVIAGALGLDGVLDYWGSHPQLLPDAPQLRSIGG
jgi:hypothetical protein